MKSEEELVNEYPDIYELWHEDPEEMNEPAPPIAVYGFQHGEGWNNIIESLCETLDMLGVEVVVAQQKEKFGGLRFYHDGVRHDDEKYVHRAMGAIRMAEEMSYRTCEECGDEGRRDGAGWIRTRCEECRDEGIERKG